MKLELYISGELIREAEVTKVRKEVILFGWKSEYKDRMTVEPWVIYEYHESRIHEIEVRLTA